MTQHTSLNQSEAEHLLTGGWQSEMMQMYFENKGERSTVRLSGAPNHPGWTMDYVLHLADNEWRLKLQDNNGERNYIIKTLNKQILEIADVSGMTIGFEKIIASDL